MRAVAIERREAGRVRLARRGQRAAERAIDVVRGARFVGARPVRVARNQPRDDRFEQVGFGGGEVLERLARPRRRRSLRGLAGRGRRGRRRIWQAAAAPIAPAPIRSSRRVMIRG